MLTSLNTGVSGLQQFQTQLDVIGNNISNSATVGYKSARTDFADAFTQTLQTASAGSPTQVQVGSGVSTSSITNRFTQGTIQETNRTSDLAIDGEGFFVVRDASSGRSFVTRAGDFSVNSEGYLISRGGQRVQGYTDSGLTTVSDLQIDGASRPATIDANAKYKGYSIDKNGIITVHLEGGLNYTRGQVLLQRVSNPDALTKEGGNLYSGFESAGPLGGTSPKGEPPGSNGLGSIASSHLEMSNVDLAGEFATMITAQRGFQASARIITTSDEILQEMVNLKR